jgi:hypothetical protein
MHAGHVERKEWRETRNKFSSKDWVDDKGIVDKIRQAMYV